MEESLLRSALEQGFIISAFLFAIIVLWKKIEKLLEQKDKLVEEVVKIALLWEAKYSKENENDQEIKESLKSIIQILSK